MRHGERKIQKKQIFKDTTSMPANRLKKYYTKTYKALTGDKLTRLGISQVKDSIAKIKQLHIDYIVSSPLSRCMQTAQIISKKLNIPIVYDPRLIDRMNYHFISHIRQDIYQNIWDNYLNYNYHTDLIEDCPNFVDRICDALDDIIDVYKNKNILIVGHSCLSYAFNAYFNGIPEDGMIPYDRMDNCEIRSYKK